MKSPTQLTFTQMIFVFQYVLLVPLPPSPLWTFSLHPCIVYFSPHVFHYYKNLDILTKKSDEKTPVGPHQTNRQVNCGSRLLPHIFRFLVRRQYEAAVGIITNSGEAV